jgi:hypothetical protein
MQTLLRKTSNFCKYYIDMLVIGTIVSRKEAKMKSAVNYLSLFVLSTSSIHQRSASFFASISPLPIVSLSFRTTRYPPFPHPADTHNSLVSFQSSSAYKKSNDNPKCKTCVCIHQQFLSICLNNSITYLPLFTSIEFRGTTGKGSSQSRLTNPSS